MRTKTRFHRNGSEMQTLVNAERYITPELKGNTRKRFSTQRKKNGGDTEAAGNLRN